MSENGEPLTPREQKQVHIELLSEDIQSVAEILKRLWDGPERDMFTLPVRLRVSAALATLEAIKTSDQIERKVA